MSWNIGIFIEGAASLDVLARDVSSLLDLKLKQTKFEGEPRYECSAEDFDLLLYANHGLDNDRDMNFEDFTYDLIFWRRNSSDRNKSQANTLEFAWLTYAKLKETRRYLLMLVEDTQKKLASYNPIG
ncbi:MAG TPA: hypothetical protein VKZ53_06770 [Candidatus Angelobacter sp.]|nr:hypothetical protein [Candidatus Angelobacter sp.]